MNSCQVQGSNPLEIQGDLVRISIVIEIVVAAAAAAAVVVVVGIASGCEILIQDSF
jgi:hypothetical protein